MRGKGFRIIVATILSTVIHFFVLVLLDTVPLISKEIPPQPSLYMVDLMPLAVEQPAPQKVEAPPVPQQVEEVKKEEVKKEEVKREEVKKEEVKKEEVKEVKQKEEVKKEDKPVAADTGTKQEKKEKTEKELPDPEQHTEAAVEGIAQSVAAREQGDSPVAEMTEAAQKEYDKKAAEEVAEFWAILNIWSEEKLKAKIVIEVDERGQVTGTRFDEPSGNPNFDDAVKRAINRAAPFDPPPGNKPREIPLSFRSH